jgi:ribosomal protein S18 acetylase RimI-like enzyme
VEAKIADTHEIRIREAGGSDWDQAMLLAYQTFLQFDAPDYTEAGIENFRKFVFSEELKKTFIAGSYQLFVASLHGQIIGMLSLREKKHISLLFVDHRFHRNGIGNALVRYACSYAESGQDGKRVTVNASPYALNFYLRIGFRKLGTEMTADGIRFTPMEIRF